MKKYSAILLVTAGILLGACAPKDTVKPIESSAATETAAVDASDMSASAKKLVDKVIKDKFQKEDQRHIQPTAAGELKPRPATGGSASGIDREAWHGTPEGMYEYKSTSVYFADEEWFLYIYTSAAPEGDGYFAFDDANKFQISMVDTVGQYVLLDDQIQLGIPEVDIYEDTEATLHVVVRDTRTASYKITDYIYDQLNGVFVENAIVDEAGINFIGSY